MSELMVDPKKIALAVITSYPKWYSGKLRSIKHTDKVRGDLALELAQKASKNGYHLVIADGKSSKTFRRELHAIPEIHIIQRKTNTSGQGKRMAIDKAIKIAGVEVIVLTEPEKVSLVSEFLPQIVTPLLEDKAEIVVPKREDAFFKSSYPRYMYDSEREGISIYNEALRTNNILEKSQPMFDFFFGPLAFRNEKALVALFKRVYHFKGMSLLERLYSPDAYSNVQMFPVVTALKKKLRVVSIEVPFAYPRLQKENEDVGQRETFIGKRSMQRVSILIDLMHFLSYLNGKKKNTRVLK